MNSFPLPSYVIESKLDLNNVCLDFNVYLQCTDLPQSANEPQKVDVYFSSFVALI
jgi:hypothetical protein